MEIFSTERGAGKTEVMLTWAAQGHPMEFYGWSRVILVSTQREVERLTQLLTPRIATSLPLADFDRQHKAQLYAEAAVVLADRWIESRSRRTAAVELGIDELDAVLTLLFRRPVVLATLTPAREEI